MGTADEVRRSRRRDERRRRTSGAGAVVALKMKAMQPGMSYFLIGMLVFLTVGMVAVVGAGFREARVEPGVEVRGWSRKSITAMAVASALLVFAIWRGNAWWGEEATAASQRIYKPLSIDATVEAPDKMQLHITDNAWVVPRKLDNLVLDHGHLMHLFLVRWPDMDRIYHLHPSEAATGYFEIELPSLPQRFVSRLRGHRARQRICRNRDRRGYTPRHYGQTAFRRRRRRPDRTCGFGQFPARKRLPHDLDA